MYERMQQMIRKWDINQSKYLKTKKTKKLTFSQKTRVYIPAHPQYSPSLCTPRPLHKHNDLAITSLYPHTYQSFITASK